MKAFYINSRTFILFVFALGAACALLYIFLNQQIKTQVVRESAQIIEDQASLRTSILKRSIDESQRHIEFFHSVAAVQGVVRSNKNNGVDPFSETSEVEWRQRLGELFASYLKANPNIAQLRLIGFENDGLELVRAHSLNNEIVIVDHAELQTKGNRDYLRATLELAENEIYISSIGLNREFGEIELPAWPTYRIAKAVFDSEGNAFGIVIANFYAQPLLNQVQESNDSDMRVFLLNENRQYIIHPQSDKSFNFEYGEEKIWDDEYLAINSNSISNALANRGISFVNAFGENQNFLVSEKTLPLEIDNEERALHLIIALDNSTLEGMAYQRQLITASVILLLFVLVVVILFFYWHSNESSKTALAITARFEALVKGSNDAIISMDASGNIENWNEAAENMYAKTGFLIQGKAFSDLFSSLDCKDLVTNNLSKTKAGDVIPNFEVVLNQDNEKVNTIAIVLSAIRGLSNEVNGVAAIMRDITEQVAMREDLQIVNYKMQNKNKEMEQFIYTVSHDLKSPLITINGFVKKVLSSEENVITEEGRRKLNRVVANVEHMAKLLGDLLELSRLIQKELAVEVCDIKECVVESCNSLEQVIKSENTSIVVNDGCVNVLANRGLLIQCLQNIIGNAIKYRDSSRDPKIVISCASNKGEFYLSIKDNGIGIEEKYFQKIFQIFERLSTGGDGSGVGLAIVNTAMEKHGGRIQIESELGKGSIFTLIFPNKKITS